MTPQHSRLRTHGQTMPLIAVILSALFVAANLSGLVSGTQNVPSNGTPLALEGQVSLYPHYYQISEPPLPPTQYVILLDVSGSMSWSLDGVGIGGRHGELVQCQGEYVEGGLPVVRCSGDGQQSAYPDPTQRRISIVGQKLSEFVERLEPYDQMQLVTFSGNLPGTTPYALTDVFDSLTTATGWMTDHAQMKSAIQSITSANNYTTAGETPSAAALARAQEIYSHAPATDPITGHQYQRITILITDGVANVTLGGVLNDCPSDDYSCQEGMMDSASLDQFLHSIKSISS